MNEFVILIPFKNSSPLRLRNLFFTITYYSKFIPSAKIILVEQNTTTDITPVKHLVYLHHHSILEEELFCRGFLFNEGYNLVPSKYYIMADGDCLPDVRLLTDIKSLEPKLEKTYVIPHSRVYYLDKPSTERFINGNLFNYGNFLDLKFEKDCATVGGVTIISAENMYNIGGYDHKWIGWGGEDDDLYNRIYVSGIIRTERLDNIMFHLQHDSNVWHHCTAEQMYEKRSKIPERNLIHHDNS